MTGRNRTFIQGTGQRLINIRRQLQYSPGEMAARLGIGLNGYYKNETGETTPSQKTLYQLQKEYGISMDWFLFNKGPVRFRDKPAETEKSQKVAETEAETEAKKSTSKEKVNPETKDLLDHMEQDPLLRHEIMVYFYKYKEKKTTPDPMSPMKS